MNKKEVNEIRKNFSDDCGFFTMNHVVQAFVDSEKNIKCKSNQLYNMMPADESELIMANLKKVLSGKIGKNLLEYQFPKDAYLEGGSQQFFYEVLQSKFVDDEVVDRFLNNIIEEMSYVSTYTIFAAHCTYSVFVKSKDGQLADESETNYNFIITAICPVNLRIDGLVYNDDPSAIMKKSGYDKIVELPSDGFLFPAFSNRMGDVNSVMYYCKNAKKPNTSIIDDLLGCEFTMSCDSEKETFKAVLNNVVGEELDYNLITTVNEKIQEIIDQNSNETELPVVDEKKLSSILWESGVSQEKLEKLSDIFKSATGDKPLTATNLIEPKTVISIEDVKLTVGKQSQNKVKSKVIDGKKCIVIEVDDPNIYINDIPANFKLEGN